MSIIQFPIEPRDNSFHANLVRENLKQLSVKQNVVEQIIKNLNSLFSSFKIINVSASFLDLSARDAEELQRFTEDLKAQIMQMEAKLIGERVRVEVEYFIEKGLIDRSSLTLHN